MLLARTLSKARSSAAWASSALEWPSLEPWIVRSRYRCARCRSAGLYAAPLSDAYTTAVSTQRKCTSCSAAKSFSRLCPTTMVAWSKTASSAACTCWPTKKEENNA